jgi:predicted enzyme related to lactoylglutathione lyase
MDKIGYDEGVPSWVDLSTSDPAAAAAFYGELFGWEAPEGPAEFGGYRNCSLRGKKVAGITGQMTPGPPAWTTYINVGSVEHTLAAAEAAGGTSLFGPHDVGDLGRMAGIADPSGAMLGLWQPGTHIGAEVVNEVGALCWNELMTTDMDRAQEFYPQVFGWSVHASPPIEYVEWQVGGASIGGMLPQPPTMPAGMPSMWSVYFTVDDTDAALKTIDRLGGRTLMEPMDIPVGRFAAVMDPQGAAFNVIALAAS